MAGLTGLRDKLNALGKTQKSANIFHCNRQRNYKNCKNGNQSFVTISYKIKFIDSARFVASSLSNLFGNLAERIHKIKCKNCDCFLEYESVKDNLIKCLSCNKHHSNRIDEELKS